MAKTQVKFLSGYNENLPEAIVDGQVYFVIADDGTGKILFDRDSKRYIMTKTDSDGNAFLTKQFYQIGTEDIYSNDLVALDKNGLIVPAASSPFLLNSPLFIASGNHKAKEIGEEVSFYDRHHNIAIKNKKEELNGSVYKPLYLMGKIYNGFFTPSSNPYTCILPKKEDGYCYLYIGEINSYTSIEGNYTYINFNSNHPIFHFKCGEIQLYTPEAQVAVAERLSHTLTIGEYQFDGSEDVEVPVYSGELR